MIRKRSFPVGLQQQWEISRLCGLFAAPVAYLIDEERTITAEVAVGVKPILSLLSGQVATTRRQARRHERRWCLCGGEAGSRPVSRQHPGRSSHREGGSIAPILAARIIASESLKM